MRLKPPLSVFRTLKGKKAKMLMMLMTPMMATESSHRAVAHVAVANLLFLYLHPNESVWRANLMLFYQLCRKGIQISFLTLKTLLSMFHGATRCNFFPWYFCLFIDNFIYEYYNYIGFYSLNSFQLLPCSPNFLLHGLLLFIIICMYIIYKYNLLSPFRVIHMYMYLGLTTWDW